MLFPLLLVSSLLVDFSHGTYHVFLIAGQSNSVGLNADGFTSEDTTSANIYQLSCCKDGNTLPIEQCTLVEAKDPLHHDCSSGYLSQETVGFGMSFAREYVKDLPVGDYIVLVPAGLSGTGFFDNTWTAFTGRGFTAAIAKLKQTFSVLANLNIDATFDGILWHQGEHDAGDNGAGNVADTNMYLNNDIIPLVEAFRNVSLLSFTSENLPFVCANLLPSWASNPDRTQRLGVWNALAVLDENIPYSACSPSQGLIGDAVYLSGLNGEVIHFTASSQRILGRRYYVSWQLAKINGEDQPPEVELN